MVSKPTMTSRFGARITLKAGYFVRANDVAPTVVLDYVGHLGHVFVVVPFLVNECLFGHDEDGRTSRIRWCWCLRLELRNASSEHCTDRDPG